MVASLSFAVSGIVDWPIALIMLVGSTTGGYLGSKAAQRVPQKFVRVTVAVIGTVSGLWLLFRT